jgi:hypothetical protein
MACYSGRRRLNSPDPPTTEPNRSGPEGSYRCTKMGAGQSVGEPG